MCVADTGIYDASGTKWSRSDRICVIEHCTQDHKEFGGKVHRGQCEGGDVLVSP